jgi:hypothetical protein
MTTEYLDWSSPVCDREGCSGGGKTEYVPIAIPYQNDSIILLHPGWVCPICGYAKAALPAELRKWSFLNAQMIQCFVKTSIFCNASHSKKTENKNID